MSKITNILFTLIRQYWKYKNSDIIIRLSIAAMFIGLSLAMGSGIWLSMIALNMEGVPAEFVFEPNQFAGLGALIIVIGLSLGIVRAKDLSQKLTGILLFHRGMEGMNTASVKKSLPKSFSQGKLTVIDINEGHQLYEGKVFHPEYALEAVSNIQQLIKSSLSGCDQNDIKLAYAGLAPIPILVAAGYKVTSRQECMVLDYNRAEGWHALNDIDDMEKASIRVPRGEVSDKVAVTISQSVGIALNQLSDELKDVAYEVSLENGARRDSLNSIDKQNRISEEIYNLLANLPIRHPDLEEIHIYMGVQASFAFKIGTMITSSVMKSISVYQYEPIKSQYSWGVCFSQGKKPFIVK